MTFIAQTTSPPYRPILSAAEHLGDVRTLAPRLSPTSIYPKEILLYDNASVPLHFSSFTSTLAPRLSPTSIYPKEILLYDNASVPLHFSSLTSGRNSSGPLLKIWVVPSNEWNAMDAFREEEFKEMGLQHQSCNAGEKNAFWEGLVHLEVRGPFYGCDLLWWF